MKSPALRLLVGFALVVLSACASAGSRPPDVAAAQVGTNVLQAATVLQNEVNRLTAATILPVALGQTITDANKQVSAKAGALSTALRAYHATTTLADKSVKAAEVQRLITDLSGPLAAMLGVQLPEGAAASVSRLIGAVMGAVSAVQAEVAKGLGSGTEAALWRPQLLLA